MTLSLFNFLYHRKQNSWLYRANDTERFKGSVVTLNNLATGAILYTQQLLRENDWQQALLMTVMIPQAFSKVRKHLAYSILQRKAHLLNPEQRFENAGEGNPYMSFAVNRLKLPAAYVFAARGLWHESVGQFERSIDDYVQAGNSATAHALFVKHIAPCYISGTSSVLSRSEQRGKLLSVLRLLSAEGAQIPNWRSQGQLLKRVLESLADAGTVVNPEGLARDLDYFCAPGNDSARYLQKAIWNLLLQVRARNNLDKVLNALT